MKSTSSSDQLLREAVCSSWLFGEPAFWATRRGYRRSMEWLRMFDVRARPGFTGSSLRYDEPSGRVLPFSGRTLACSGHVGELVLP